MSSPLLPVPFEAAQVTEQSGRIGARPIAVRTPIRLDGRSLTLSHDHWRGNDDVLPCIRFAWSVHQRMGKRWGYCSLGKSGNLRDLLICPIAGTTATSLIEGSPAWEETQAHPGRRAALRHHRPVEASLRTADRLEPGPQRRRPDEHSALYRGRHPPKAPEHQVDQGPGQSAPASQGGVSLVLARRYLQG